MIWWTRVVLPDPGGPATRLKENSGSPPPRTSSRPLTPVRRRLIVTLSVMPDDPAGTGCSKVSPDVAKQSFAQRGADQAAEQIAKRLQQRTAGARGGGRASLGERIG